MSMAQELPEDVSDSIFINQVAGVFAAVAYPFMAALLAGGSNIVLLLVFIIVGRYCRSLRQRAEKRNPTNPIAVQDYVVRLAWKFAVVRVCLVAVVALFIKHPYGLVYFFGIAVASFVEVVWESGKLRDVKDKVANQPPVPAASGHGTS